MNFPIDWLLLIILGYLYWLAMMAILSKEWHNIGNIWVSTDYVLPMLDALTIYHDNLPILRQGLTYEYFWLSI